MQDTWHFILFSEQNMVVWWLEGEHRCLSPGVVGEGWWPHTINLVDQLNGIDPWLLPPPRLCKLLLQRLFTSNSFYLVSLSGTSRNGRSAPGHPSAYNWLLATPIKIFCRHHWLYFSGFEVTPVSGHGVCMFFPISHGWTRHVIEDLMLKQKANFLFLTWAAWSLAESWLWFANRAASQISSQLLLLAARFYLSPSTYQSNALSRLQRPHCSYEAHASWGALLKTWTAMPQQCPSRVLPTMSSTVPLPLWGDTIGCCASHNETRGDVLWTPASSLSAPAWDMWHIRSRHAN